MPKLNKVLAVYDRNGNRQAIPLYSSLSDVNNLGRHIKVAGIGDAYYPLTENLSHANASNKTVVIGNKTYKALLTINDADTGVKLMGSYTRNDIVRMISDSKGSPLADKEIESFTFSPSMHDSSIGSWGVNPFSLNNYVSMGSYDNIGDTDNWHFATLIYCGDPVTSPQMDNIVPFSYSDTQTNTDLGCVLSIGEKSFKDSLKNNKNKFKYLSVALKRHDPSVKNGRRLDGYSIIITLTDTSDTIVYTKTLTLMYSDSMDKSKFRELFPEIAQKQDTTFAGLTADNKIGVKVIIGNEVPHIIDFNIDATYDNPSVRFNLIKIEDDLNYNIRSMNSGTEVKPFSSDSRFVGDAARDANNNPMFRLSFTDLVLTKRQVSADIKREIGSNNLFFMISNGITNSDSTILENYYLFNRMAIINNTQYEGSKYCRVAIKPAGVGYDSIEQLEDELNTPKMYPLRLKEF